MVSSVRVIGMVFSVVSSRVFSVVRSRVVGTN
jgi:hypothetical protein